MSITFVLKETFRTIKLNKLNFFFSATVQALCLLLLLIFVTITLNLTSVVKEVHNRIEIYAFLDEKSSYQKVADKVFLIAGIKEVRYVSQDEALEELKDDLGEDASLLKGIDKNPLPNSLRIKLEQDFQSSFKIREVEKKISAIPGIKEVWSGREVLEKLERLLRIAFFSNFLLLAIVGLAVIFIIFQNIESTIFHRRREIEIMRLVGATDYLVNAPFYGQGFLQGILGGLIAFLILSLLAYLASFALPKFLFPHFYLFLFAITLGSILGIFGSYAALARIKERKNN